MQSLLAKLQEKRIYNKIIIKCVTCSKCVTCKYLWCKYHKELWWSRAVRQGHEGSSQVGIKGSLIDVVVGGVSHSIFGTKNVSPAPGGWSSLTQVQYCAHPELRKSYEDQARAKAYDSPSEWGCFQTKSVIRVISRTTQNANYSFSRWQKQSSHKTSHVRPFFHILAQCSFYYIKYLLSSYSWCLWYSKWSYP